MQANFDEARQSQLPAVELLINMGYTYLPCAEAQRLRKEDNSKFLPKEIAFSTFEICMLMFGIEVSKSSAICF